MGILNAYSKYVDQECSYARVDDFLQACLDTIRKRKKHVQIKKLYELHGHLCHLADISTLDRIFFYWCGCMTHYGHVGVKDVNYSLAILETL